MKMREIGTNVYFTVTNRGVFLKTPILLRGRKDIRAKWDFEFLRFETIEELVTYLEERIHLYKKKLDIDVDKLVEKIYENIEVVHYKIDIEEKVRNSINLGVRWSDRLSPNKIRYENLAKEQEERERIEEKEGEIVND